MRIAKVKLADGRVAKFEVEEGTPIADIEAAAAKIPLNMFGVQAQKNNAFENALYGFGGSMKGLALGAGQRLGLVDQSTIDEHKMAMEGLETTKAGKTGSFAGIAVPAAATSVIPGANTYLGAALTGAAFGAATPTGEDESVATNIALGTAGGMGGKYLGDKFGSWATDRLAKAKTQAAAKEAQNLVRDTTAREAADAGYVVTPSQVGKKSFAESLSGKFKTNQMAGLKNQNVTNRLARKAIGLDENTPLTPATLQNIRNEAFERGYTPVTQAGKIKVDDEYLTAMSKITETYEGAAKSFPGAAKKEVTDMVDSLLVDSFDAGDAIKMTRILRDDAAKAFRGGDNALGKALRKASDAIENQIERHLSGQGKQGATALKQFADARKLIAKTHTVEEALEESTGNIDATKIASIFKKGKPLSGELKTIGKIGEAFRETTRLPKTGDANPVTVLDMFGSTGLGGLAAAGTANPMAAAAGLAWPAARIGARHLVTRGAATPPTYGPGLTKEALELFLNNPYTKSALEGSAIAGSLYPY